MYYGYFVLLFAQLIFFSDLTSCGSFPLVCSNVLHKHLQHSKSHCGLYYVQIYIHSIDFCFESITVVFCVWWCAVGLWRSWTRKWFYLLRLSFQMTNDTQQPDVFVPLFNAMWVFFTFDLHIPWSYRWNVKYGCKC